MSEADEQKVYRFLGLCARARGLTSGETGVIGAVKAGKAHLVIVASDTSGNTQKRYRDKCLTHDTALVFFGTAEKMGEAIGKNNRSAVAVTETHFAEELKKQITLLNKEL